jgi:AraC-like DNA-binding protein
MKNSMMHEQLTIDERYPIIARYYDYKRFTYSWHFHREYEIIYVREGSGERFVADSVDFFYPGDLILLGHNVPHYMRSAREYYTEDGFLRTKGVIIQFENDYMSHAIGTYADLAPVKSLLEKSKRGIHFPHPANAALVKCIEELPTYKGVERIVRLLLLLDKMANFGHTHLLGSPQFNENFSTFTDDRLNKILSYINYHYTETIKLSDMASLVSMNLSAFCRYFKKRSGKLFVEYIQDLRVGYACKLLVGSSHDISQISIECGFNTLSHFNKIFKHKTGLTPTEYRSQFLK